MEKLLLRPNEAAEIVGIGRATIYALIKSGEIPSVRIGGSVRIPADALKQWVHRKGRDKTRSAR
jgi:excisionase family DNA binding protein